MPLHILPFVDDMFEVLVASGTLHKVLNRIREGSEVKTVEDSKRIFFQN